MTNVSNHGYSGPERRTNRVFVTRNHEYHCHAGVCVAVRDTQSGEFIPNHTAIGKKLSAAVVLGKNGIESISMPEDAQRGQRLHFAAHIEDRHDLLTSPLQSIERPPIEVARQYRH